MKILFISHNASRTGAPVLLLRLAKELAKNASLQLGFLVDGNGPLIEDFKMAGIVCQWQYFPKNLLARIYDRLWKMIGLPQFTFAEAHKRKIKNYVNGYDIILVNTTWSIHMVRELELTGKKVMPYIHELQVMASIKASPADMQWLSAISYRTLVPCNYVKKFLIEQYHFEENKMGLLHYIVSPATGINKRPAPRTDGLFRIGACGTLDWRKGYDLFLQVALKMCHLENGKDIRFEWVGADLQSVEYLILMTDIKKTGLEKYITIHGSVAEMGDYFSNWDLFLLTSREDPFPLVVQEAAAFGIPTVCFKGAGGITEFLKDDGGIAVDYLNINQCCDAIDTIRNNPSLRSQMAETVRERSAEYNDAHVIASEFLSYCEDLS